MSLGLFLAVLVCWECIWRFRGFSADSSDDDNHWVATRLRVERSSVVLTGSSRIQTDLDPQLWAGSQEPPPLQLAVAAGSFLPVLENLAGDGGFGGTVIVDVMPQYVFDMAAESDQPPSKMLAGYRVALTSPAKWSEARLRFLICGRFAFQSPVLSMNQFLHYVVLRKLPHQVLRLRKDRWRALDFSQAESPERMRDLTGFHYRSLGQPASETERDSIIHRITFAARRIEERGGRVIFIQFPRSGVIRNLEELQYPRRKYWDVLTRAVRGPALTVDDYPSMAQFRGPDGSHLDFRDVPQFTLRLRAIVAREMAR